MSIKSYHQQLKSSYNIPWAHRGHFLDRQIERCPYCSSRKIVKRGRRRTKHEIVQLYQCQQCQKTFTPKILKGKQYPLKVIFDSLSFYNLGHNKADTCRLLKEKYGLKVCPDTLTNWISELSPLCRYERIREKIQPHYRPHRIIKSAILNHQQIYHYRYHQAKLDRQFAQSSFAHPRFHGLKAYLESIPTDFPHHYFQTNKRSSNTTIDFDFNQVQIQQKENFATRLAQLVLQAVTDNYVRHEALQQFMLINDSFTVAMEIPIVIKLAAIEMSGGVFTKSMD